jgi:hypothetical protein
MAQSTFRRRGTGSCPHGDEPPDGSPVDAGHPRATAGRPDSAGNTDRDDIDGAPTDNLLAHAVRQQRLADSLSYAGGATSVIGGSGPLLVGAHRGLW